jgi:hypothetical protein
VRILTKEAAREAELNGHVLRSLLEDAHVLAGFAELDVHPGVPDGMRQMADAGVRMVTLTNGARRHARGTSGKLDQPAKQRLPRVLRVSRRAWRRARHDR